MLLPLKVWFSKCEDVLQAYLSSIPIHSFPLPHFLTTSTHLFFPYSNPSPFSATNMNKLFSPTQKCKRGA